MKTTLEIPDPIFRRAKAKASERGIPLRQFITEAVEEKLQGRTAAGELARIGLAGRLKHLRSETRRINRLMDREFEKIEPEDRV